MLISSQTRCAFTSRIAILCVAAFVAISCSQQKTLADDIAKRTLVGGKAELTVPPTASLLATQTARAQLQGIAEAKKNALVKVNQPGVVVELLVSEGERVRAGSPLLRLDDRIAAAKLLVAKAAAGANGNVQQAQATLEQAQAQYERTDLALRNGASSDFEVFAKQSQVRVAAAALALQMELRQQAEAELQVAQAELDALTLTAPFDGEVVQIRAQEGNTLALDDVAIRVADLSVLRVEMYLPLEYYGQLSVGNTYRFSAGQPLNSSIQGVATYVSPVVESTGNTFRATFEIANANREIPAGIEVWFEDLP